MSVNNKTTGNFWQAYQSCVETQRVNPDHAPFYVRWAKAFEDYLPEKRLQDRTGSDVSAFLKELAGRQNVTEWQVNQARRALSLLYEQFLPQYAPAQQLADAPDGKASVGRDRFRDVVLPGEVERRYGAILTAMATEIRARHYSYRTETTYLDWVRRFIAFHAYQNPHSLNAAHAVRAYLEYLAIEREIAASTQNQALNALVFPTRTMPATQKNQPRITLISRMARGAPQVKNQILKTQKVSSLPSNIRAHPVIRGKNLC